MSNSLSMWHAAGMARQYEAAGSRTQFTNKWSPEHTHKIEHRTPQIPEALQVFIDVLADERKAKWLDGFEQRIRKD